jgi:transposase/heme-degrading monooxygenase HmoA
MEHLCRSLAFPVMREQAGFLGVRIQRIKDDRPDDFVLATFWRDVESIRAFVGEQWQEAIIMPGEADLLQEMVIRHFDESYRSLVKMWHAMADVVKRRELALASTPLTHEQWQRVQELLPPPKRAGRPRADDQRTLEGILYVLRAGCRWRDLPVTYGSPITCWRRFTQWRADGTWDRIWLALLDTLDTPGKLAWALAFMDCPGAPFRSGTTMAPTKRRRYAAATPGVQREAALVE